MAAKRDPKGLIHEVFIEEAAHMGSTRPSPTFR
jgi:hypothetical protein